MYFGLSEDQAAIRDSVRGFARAKLAPGYLERAKSDRFPWDVHREIAGLGVFGLLAGEEFNPLAAEDFVAAGLAVEELAYADVNLANAAIPVLLMTALIARHAGEPVRRAWLRPLVEGGTYVCLGLTEPGCGSDVTAIQATATATADGYLISGDKASVTMLEPRRGDHRDRPDRARWRAGGPFSVPGPAGRSRGDQVPAPGHRLGAAGPRAAASRPGRGTRQRPARRRGRGLPQRARRLRLHPATARADRHRLRPGQRWTTPPVTSASGTRSGPRWPDSRACPSRWLSTRPTWRRRGCCAIRRCGTGRPAEPHTALAAMTKWYGPYHASQAIRDCLLLHGNVGYSAEFPLEQRMRDVLAVEIADGTAQIQKIIIARELFGRQFVPYGR